MKATVLIFGYNDLLNDTRARILEREGIAVFRTSDKRLVEALMAERAIHVLILCHTIPPDLCDHLLHLAHDLHPEMKTALLYKDRPPVDSEPLHRTVGALDGPTELTSIIQALLNLED